MAVFFFILLYAFFCGTSSGLLSFKYVEAAGETLSITLDGVAVKTDVPPFIDENSRTIVPVRLISEALGCWVGWNSDEQLVRISRAGMTIVLRIGEKIAYVNDKEIKMDAAPVIKQGRTMVPLRFIAESFGLKVEWKQRERTVALYSPPPKEEKDRIAGRQGELEGSLTPDNIKPQNSFTLPAGVSRRALVMKDTVNIRSAPGTENPVIAQVGLGEELDVTGEKNGWYAVRLSDGSQGWIAGWLVATRYEADKKENVNEREEYPLLLSRWAAGVPQINTNPPLISKVEVERLGEGVLLKVSATSRLELPASFRLENPSRLVFDFQAQLGEGQVPAALNAGYGSVDRFRIGQFNEQTVRIVADLRGTVSYALTQDPSGRVITVQIRPLNAEGKIIVIDPGHGALQDWGGSDPGAVGPSGLKERDVVRSISLHLGNILLNEGFTVIYTREGDTSLTLEERAKIGSLAKAELLVSIHTNASTNPSVSGTMTFYHAPRGTALESQIDESRMLASFIQRELVNRLQRDDKGVREANFLVLRSSSIPAVLVEVAFISNPEEEKLLADPAFQKKAAEAIALGIKRYLAQKNT